MNVLAFGEILWDIIEGRAYIGGAPFNVAAHLAQLGASSYIVSKLGKDDFGEQAFAKVKELDVHTDYIQWDDKHPTGTVDVFLEKGQPDYTIHLDVAYDYIQPLALSQSFDCLYFGTLAQRSKYAKEALEHIIQNNSFKEVFYDVNLRKGIHLKELIAPSLEVATILKLNEGEVKEISTLLWHQSYDLAAFVEKVTTDYPIHTVIITQADKGCKLFSNGKWFHIEGIPITLKDAVGAGDAFSAAFIYTYLQLKLDVIEAASLANQLGAFVAASDGAIPSYNDYIHALFKS